MKIVVVILVLKASMFLVLDNGFDAQCSSLQLADIALNSSHSVSDRLCILFSNFLLYYSSFFPLLDLCYCGAVS